MPERPDLSTAQKLPIPAPGDTAPHEHGQRWLAHVAAGRIGGRVRVASVANPSPNPSPHGEGGNSVSANGEAAR